MHNVETKQVFLCEMKEEGIPMGEWIPTEINDSDMMFTKNLEGPLFKNFSKVYVGDKKYM